MHNFHLIRREIWKLRAFLTQLKYSYLHSVGVCVKYIVLTCTDNKLLINSNINNNNSIFGYLNWGLKNNNNNSDNFYGICIITRSQPSQGRRTLGSSDECRAAPSGRRLSHRANRLIFRLMWIWVLEWTCPHTSVAKSRRKSSAVGVWLSELSEYTSVDGRLEASIHRLCNLVCQRARNDRTVTTHSFRQHPASHAAAESRLRFPSVTSLPLRNPPVQSIELNRNPLSRCFMSWRSYRLLPSNQIFTILFN